MGSPLQNNRGDNDGHQRPPHHPDLLVAAAVNAPVFEQRALERYAMYEADAFGRGLLPQMHELLAVCGLHISR